MKHLFVLFIMSFQMAASMTWNEYKAKFRKSYSVEEDAARQSLFEQANIRITEHNKRFERGHEMYSMGHNAFSDMTPSKKSRRLGRLSGKTGSVARIANQFVVNSNLSQQLVIATARWNILALPPTYDLRNSKCMPPIKNQGICGSCWAFSATTPIEYQKCMKTYKLITMSEQQLVDCVYNSTYDGCDGGYEADAWKYIYRVGGYEASYVYPYTSGLTGTNTPCRFSHRKVYAKLANGGTSLPQNELAMQRALVEVGPISFAFCVVDSFFYYSKGIYSDPRCPKDFESINHAMVIVGYGVQHHIPYWIVRNSWGTDWGMAGYVFVKRGTNECGLADDSGYPTVI